MVPQSVMTQRGPGSKKHRTRHDILKYLPGYRVVICKECRFAVQPKALSSHLKRHQVYQKDRTTILHRFSRLDVAKPEDVPKPSNDAAPFLELELYEGLKCQAATCDYACTSPKRMSQHWSSVHGIADSSLAESRRAWLQTFFKGSEIRYFEVARGQTLTSAQESHFMSSNSRRRHNVDPEAVRSPSAPTSGPLSWTRPSEQIDVARDVSPDGLDPPLDLTALMYFHCFITSVSSQFSRSDLDTPEFWTKTVPEIAARQTFLMYGILAAAAFHQAWHSFAIDKRASKRHYDEGIKYQAVGLRGYREAIASPTQDNGEAVLLFGRLVGIQNCIDLQLRMESDPQQDPIAVLVEFLVFLHGAVQVALDMQELLPADSRCRWSRKARTYAAVTGLHNTQESRFEVPGSALQAVAVPESVRCSLVSLSDELSHSPGPTTEEDSVMHKVLCSLDSAVAESYDTTGQCPRTALWNGIDNWIVSLKLRSEFMEALKEGNHAPLAIFGFFCILLLNRVGEQTSDVSGLPGRLVGLTLRLMHGSSWEKLLSRTAHDHSVLLY